MRKFHLVLIILLQSVTLFAQERVTLLFVGDLMQHDAQIKAARTPEGEYNYTDCFCHVKEEISSADLAIGNLEVTLGGKPYRGYPSFSAPDEYLYAIRDAGFDILLTANNHCLDRGKRGIERTITMLDSLHIPYLGTYRDEAHRKERYPLMVEVKGIRIAFLGYTYDTNGLRPTSPNQVNYIDKEIMKEDIRKARSMHPDVIIACMHWGTEYRPLPDNAERKLADWLISQGVHHVIGSHPHVLQPMEVKTQEDSPARHVVVYSLGNFISNMSKTDTDGGAMVKLELTKAFHITRLTGCSYSFVWTSSPQLSGKKNFEIYPSSFITQPLRKEEYNHMKLFLDRARNLYQKHNKGIEEY